ncbi:hypothetical protein [Paenisporosarcina antarctica]|uniref:Lipoprotein n=1 Tax=Paenisporosarcina antarctica TaxID=417367 RepID=A0A4V1AMV8_9BACL|nr:hypothetical protein [Paenisporosarcina antarctica]QBP40625.1 hypothetical protein E2636_05640 [Paenisporosarcina antarctica]
MSRNWLRIAIAPFIVITLVACSDSAEEQTGEGIKVAKELFQNEPVEPNEQIKSVELFVPGGFSIQEDSDDTNIILNSKSDLYVLFINPNEEQDSHLFYDLLNAEKKNGIYALETFEQNGRFGFIAVLPSGDEQFEIMASIGGLKLTTISKKANIYKNIEQMMKIVRSVKIDA